MNTYNFKNLAGNQDCDRVIVEELALTGIKPKKHVTIDNGEVPFSITGSILNDSITFKRAWRYWCVFCNLPYQSVLEFHNKFPELDNEVRVNGHAGGYEAGLALCEWKSKSTGRILIHADQIETYKDPDLSAIWEYIQEALKTTHEISDNFERDGEAFITSFHIDTLYGLKAFADHFKQ